MSVMASILKPSVLFKDMATFCVILVLFAYPCYYIAQTFKRNILLPVFILEVKPSLAAYSEGHFYRALFQARVLPRRVLPKNTPTALVELHSPCCKCLS